MGLAVSIFQNRLLDVSSVRVARRPSASADDGHAVGNPLHVDREAVRSEQHTNRLAFDEFAEAAGAGASKLPHPIVQAVGADGLEAMAARSIAPARLRDQGRPPARNPRGLKRGLLVFDSEMRLSPIITGSARNKLPPRSNGKGKHVQLLQYELRRPSVNQPLFAVVESEVDCEPPFALHRSAAPSVLP
jgi:hypothetical protein